MAEKQLMINKIAENKGLAGVNQILTQVKVPQRLKAHIQKTLNGSALGKPVALCWLQGI